jgi:hypothetical protein
MHSKTCSSGLPLLVPWLLMSCVCLLPAGLHVQEMMQTLPQQLAALSKQQHESVSVIVGVGRHTKGPPTARMGPAAEALLKELGYSVKQPQPGLLRVHLR